MTAPTSVKPESGPGNPPPPQPPHWVQVAALVCGALVLAFFMSLVIASVLGHEVPCGSRFLVVVVFALGVGLAFSYIGGTAAAKGHIVIPKLTDNPFTFAVAGGIAALLIVLVMGNALYANSSGCSDVITKVRLHGQVLDSDSKPISGAQITVEGHDFIARSEPNGDFEGELGSVRRDDYIRVRITHRQFNSVTRTIPVHDAQILIEDIHLTPFR